MDTSSLEPDSISLDDVLRDRAVRAIYQPIVYLGTGSIVGYEALARGPAGTNLERPDLLFAAARNEGRVDELDWLCRGAAILGAIEGRLDPPLTLFVNLEPTALTSPPPPELESIADIASTRLRGVAEITERAIAHQPAELLAALAAIRDHGWGVAVDDVGAEAHSLAIMPFLRPDVIKLDLRLVRDRPDPQIASTVNAVSAHVERTGALVLAEGIETEEHRETALAMGASLGQGWFFGRPGPLPADISHKGPEIPFITSPKETFHTTPWDVVANSGRARVANKALLASMARRLESVALDGSEQPVVISCFQEERFFSRSVRRRYASLAQGLPLVAAMGVGMSHEPAPGVRGASLEEDDPLRRIWAVHVIGPYFSGALVGQDMGDEGPEHERRFRYVLTYKRDLVISSAHALLRRIVPL